MSEKPLTSVTYWNHFIRYGSEQNIDLKGVIKRIGPRKHQDFIPFEALKALIYEIFQKSDRNWVGLDAAEQLKVSSHGSLGFAVTHGVDLKECIALISRYYQTRMQAMKITTFADSETFTMEVTETCDWQPITVVMYETLLISLLNMIQYVIGSEIQLCTIDLPYQKPEWHAKYYEILPCSFSFNQKVAAINIPASLLSISCITSNPRSVGIARNQCRQELERINQYETMYEKIHYLIENSPIRSLSVETIASQLNMSKSTLSRKLKLENTSYKGILESYKKQQSTELLIHSENTVEVIAYHLGYEDASNFARSFKRWFGCSPSKYREKHTFDSE